jgi:Cu-Zn family superoxide dismutase
MTTVVATCVLIGENISGCITFEQDAKGGATTIRGEVKGLAPGLHGFHVHQYGDLSQGCASAGGHFNPFGLTHASPSDEKRHVGDLGNVEAKNDGTAVIDITDNFVSLIGSRSVIGRSIVVHAGEDDLGKGGNDESLKTGNAGGRVACGVIGLAKERTSN